MLREDAEAPADMVPEGAREVTKAPAAEEVLAAEEAADHNHYYRCI